MKNCSGKIDELTKQDELKSEIAKIQVKGLTSYLDQLKDDEKITQLKNIKDQLWTMAKKLETDMQKEVDEAMSDVNLQLDGSDMLRALQDTSTLQRKLKQQTSTAISKAVENAKTVFNSFLSPSGMHCPDQAFSSTWPTENKPADHGPDGPRLGTTHSLSSRSKKNKVIQTIGTH